MSEQIRILHVLTEMNYAGTETLLMNFYRNIDRDRIQFDFAVSAEKECSYDKEIIEMGGRIFHYPKYTVKNHFQYKKWWKRFFENHPEYNIVHGHIGSTAAIYLGIAKRSGRFTIAHSHSIDDPISIKALAYKIYSFPTRFIADYFFGCSNQALIDRYGKRIANDKSRASVLNNAINADKYIYNENTRRVIRKELKISENTFVLGTVGRLAPEKNPYEIIRICKELKDRGVQFIFLWFGKGELYEDLANKIVENELSEQIVLCGTRPDICNVLQAMDVFIFPSIFEGLGIAGVEAQAAGLPTLCSDTIPIEAKATDLCEFLKLNDTRLWCDEIEKWIGIISAPSYKRQDVHCRITEAGYDVKEVAAKLSNFFF